MSVKKIIYKAIQTHLMAKLNADTNSEFPNHLPSLKWFDKQMSQFTDAEKSFALPLPTILMEYGQFTWTTTGKNTQKGDGVIRFYIYFENYADSFTGSINQELALQFFEFGEAVHQALQGVAIANILSPLDRVADAEDAEQDMIITSILEYNATIYDASTNVSRNYIEVEPDLNVEYKKESSRPPQSNEPVFLT